MPIIRLSFHQHLQVYIFTQISSKVENQGQKGIFPFFW